MPYILLLHGVQFLSKSIEKIADAFVFFRTYLSKEWIGDTLLRKFFALLGCHYLLGIHVWFVTDYSI